MDNIICPYKNECTRYPLLCKTCEHNKGKKNHYKPMNPPLIPPRVPPRVNPWGPEPIIPIIRYEPKNIRDRFRRMPMPCSNPGGSPTWTK